MITDAKLIGFSIKIIFFAVRVYTAMIATLGRMIEFSLTPPQAPPGPRGLSCVATRSVSVRTFREAQLVPRVVIVTIIDARGLDGGRSKVPRAAPRPGSNRLVFAA